MSSLKATSALLDRALSSQSLGLVLEAYISTSDTDLSHRASMLSMHDVPDLRLERRRPHREFIGSSIGLVHVSPIENGTLSHSISPLSRLTSLVVNRLIMDRSLRVVKSSHLGLADELLCLVIATGVQALPETRLSIRSLHITGGSSLLNLLLVVNDHFPP